MADDSVYADLLDALSPVTKAGMDPDEAAADRAGTMAKLLGPDDAPKPKWYEQGEEVAQNDVPPRPGASPNGNPLPPGLRSRQDAVPTPTPDSTPAVPAGVTPSGNATKPDLAAGNAATIALMQSDYARASKDVQNEAAQPDEQTVLAPLERQRVSAQQRQVELQTPYGPDGKTLPEYKPSFGQRFMRGVEGFAGGGVLGVVDPKVGGAQPYGAPNKEYGIDQTQAAGRVAGADQQLKQAADAWKATQDRLSKIAAERRALAVGGKNTTDASIAQQDQPNKDKEADAKVQDAYNASPEGKSEDVAKTMDARFAQGKKQGLKGTELERFTLGLGQEEFAPNAEIISRQQALAGWKHDHPNQTPGLEDWRTINAAASGSEIKNSGKMTKTQSDKAIDMKKAAMDKATALYRDGMDKAGQPYKKEDWKADMQAAQDTFEEEIENHGGSVDHMTIGDDGNWTAEAGSVPRGTPAPASSTTPKLGADGSWPDKPRPAGKTAVITPDGQQAYVLTGKLSVALSRGYKKAK